MSDDIERRVTALQGNPVSKADPTTGQILEWDGSKWAPTTLRGGLQAPVTASVRNVAGLTYQIDSDGYDYIINELPHPDYTMAASRMSKVSTIGVTRWNQQSFLGAYSGVVTLTNGSPNVVWVSGLDFTNFTSGDAFITKDVAGVVTKYTVLSVINNHNLILTTNFNDTTGNGTFYDYMINAISGSPNLSTQHNAFANMNLVANMHIALVSGTKSNIGYDIYKVLSITDGNNIVLTTNFTQPSVFDAAIDGQVDGYFINGSTSFYTNSTYVNTFINTIGLGVLDDTFSGNKIIVGDLSGNIQTITIQSHSTSTDGVLTSNFTGSTGIYNIIAISPFTKYSLPSSPSDRRNIRLVGDSQNTTPYPLPLAYSPTFIMAISSLDPSSLAGNTLNFQPGSSTSKYQFAQLYDGSSHVTVQVTNGSNIVIFNSPVPVGGTFGTDTTEQTDSGPWTMNQGGGSLGFGPGALINFSSQSSVWYQILDVQLDNYQTPTQVTGIVLAEIYTGTNNVATNAFFNFGANNGNNNTFGFFIAPILSGGTTFLSIGGELVFDQATGNWITIPATIA